MKLLFAAWLLVLSATPASAMDKVYHSLLDADLDAKKGSVIAKVMGLSEADAAIFNPIYENYQKELGRLNDNRRILMQEFAAVQGAMSPEIAEVMTKQFLELEKKELEIKQKYLKKIEAEMSPNFASVFYHVDTKLSLMVNLQIATKLPLMPRP